jgi:hypothetical protein
MMPRTSSTTANYFLDAVLEVPSSDALDDALPGLLDQFIAPGAAHRRLAF